MLSFTHFVEMRDIFHDFNARVIDGQIDRRMKKWTEMRMDRQMDEWMDGQTGVIQKKVFCERELLEGWDFLRFASNVLK